MAKEGRTGPPAVTLKIPAALYQTLTKRIEGTGFRSVTEFAVHVLRDVAAGGKMQRDESGFSSQEIELVRRRLRALGYME